MEILFFIGRVLFGGYFLYNAYNHFANHKSLTAYARAKHIPMPEIAVFGTGILLFLGGLFVLLDYRVVLGLWLLVLFLVPTTFLMHAFWREKDPQLRSADQLSFTKNLALIGALLMLIVLRTLLP